MISFRFLFSVIALVAGLLAIGVPTSRVHAQLAGWSYVEQIDIANQTPTPLVNYAVLLTINTQSLISQGFMSPDGNDIRFGTDCAGLTLLTYWLEGPMNNVATKIWVRIPSIAANGTVRIYMYYGNPSAPSTSTLSVFNGPYSSTDQVSLPNTNTVDNCQRGFRWSANKDILITSFGKKVPNGTARYVTLFNFSTQALVAQVQVPSGSSTAYQYQALPAPLWITQGVQYLIEEHNENGDTYYYGTSSQINSNLTYYDMRYCNSCSQNTFPTTSLGNIHYGIPDFQFYFRDQIVSPEPTFTIIPGGCGPIQIKLPGGNVTSVSSGCGAPGAVTKVVRINNGEGTNNAALQWQASSNDPRITILTPNGIGGQDLRFNFDPSGLAPGSYSSTVTITGQQVGTGTPAPNSPYTLTVNLFVEPAGTVSKTLPVGTSGWTTFTNAMGHPYAAVKSNTTALTGFTVTMTPCTIPNGFARLRYARRIFQLTPGVANANVGVRFYSTNSEFSPLVTRPDLLKMYRQPWNPGSWVLIGGTSNPSENYVEVASMTTFTGTFAMAHIWNPKTLSLSFTNTGYDRFLKQAVLEWGTDLQTAEGFMIERMMGDDPETGDWESVGTVGDNPDGTYRFTETVADGRYYYRLVALGKDGESYESEPISLNAFAAPAVFSLSQNFPNPFNPVTTISYSLPTTSTVSLKVYDSYWREVATLVNEEKGAGSYEVTFDATNRASGVYFYRIEAGEFTKTMKMNLLK